MRELDEILISKDLLDMPAARRIVEKYPGVQVRCIETNRHDGRQAYEVAPLLKSSTDQAAAGERILPLLPVATAEALRVTGTVTTP